jgi:hypothetical protein
LVSDRLAITEQQIAEHNLPVIEKWDKHDRRYQEEIERIVRNALDESLAVHGNESLAAIRAEEERQRDELRPKLGIPRR